MKPTGNNIMLSPIAEGEKKTASGIIYQLETSKPDAPTKKGKILQIGCNVNSKMKNGKHLKEGDVLNYFPETATELVHNGEPVVIVHVSNVVSRD